MTDPITLANLDEFRQAYVSGKSVKELAGQFGVTVLLVWQAIHQLISPAVIEAYRGGMSVLAIARRFGIQRDTVRRILTKASIPIRNASEANTLRMQRLTREERLALASAAHDAVRRRVVPAEQRIRLAEGKERTPLPNTVSDAENQLADLLRRHGFVPDRQVAIGPYNVDLLVDAVAVEVFCGNWHTTPKHARIFQAKLHYLLDLGYDVLVVRLKRLGDTLTVDGLNELITFIQATGSDPSAPCQYRMIRSNGQLIATRCVQCDHLALKSSYGPRDKVWCEHLRPRQ